jgi:branched-subunit amino acid ABC-type transport system permease component
MVPFILAIVLATLYIIAYTYTGTKIKKVSPNLVIAARLGHTNAVDVSQSTINN